MIGIFDSGVGGLGVWREITELLPGRPTLYLADQAHCPYGSRPLEEVQALSLWATKFLLSRGAQIVVIACNTASAAALYYLRASFPEVPFVGMEPALKPAAERSRARLVGVLATPATFQGEPYARLLARFGKRVRVLAQPCPQWVELVESRNLDGAQARAIVQQSVRPLVEAGVDTLVLGCTHFPFLRPLIEVVAGPEIEIIDPAPAVARQVVRVWGDRPCRPEKEPQFFTTGDPAHFQRQVRALLNANMVIELQLVDIAA